MKFKFIAKIDNPYKENTREWHCFIDFACMEDEFTLSECFKHHGLHEMPNSFVENYYTSEIVKTFLKNKFIEMIKE